MTIFEKVKASVTPREAAQRYGFRIANNSMICCPFHNDNRPSMKLNSDYFYCFGCGENGDVIDFVSKLFKISPIAAAMKLADDFGIDKNDCAGDLPAKVKHPKIKAFREDEHYCFSVLCAYLHILQDWKVRYAPKTEDEEYDDRFSEACAMIDCIEYLVDFLTVAELDERLTAVQELLSDGKLHDLEKRIECIRKEEEHEQKGNS